MTAPGASAGGAAPGNAAEAERLAALHALGLLDGPPEQRFDDLALLARQVADAPIALVSLVDEARQWFKAKVGLDADETPRSMAFCAHAIAQEGVMVVPDAAADPRFADNPLVTGAPFIRFYAGAPILAEGRYPIGTICVIDTAPRSDFAAAPALAALARQASALVDLRAIARAQDALADGRARALAAATRDLDQLWNMAHELMIVTDLEARLLAVNPAFEALFGPLPATGQARPMDWHHPDEDPTPHLPLPDTPERFRRRYRDRDGNDRLISWTVTRDGERLFGVGRDDTALQAAEDNLRHAQKMEAVGRLTGGIAHDFNNLLTIVIGNLDMARGRLGADGDPRLARALSQANEGASRAATLTQRLLAFARRQPLAPRVIDPARHLDAARPLLERAVGERVRLDIRCHDGCWPVLADATQLESALLNLAVNARDAMADATAAGGGDGRLTVGTANVTISHAEASRHGVATREFVRFSVADTGIGMDAATVERVFEPFFTTKPAGRGTGLGLSQVHGFVTQSGGFVTVETAPGAGAAINLWLPRAAASPADDPMVARDAPAAGNGASVLVVEDNDGVREMLVTTLREAGYRVVEAHDGAAGLALFERQAPSPDLIVSDVQMPNMDGTALAAAIRAQRADARILLITGYAEAAAEVSGYPLLTKPFTRHALLAKVSGLVAEAAAG